MSIKDERHRLFKSPLTHLLKKTDRCDSLDPTQQVDSTFIGEVLPHRLASFKKLHIGDPEALARLLNDHGIRRVLTTHKSGSSSLIVPFSAKCLALKLSNHGAPHPGRTPEEIHHPLLVLKESNPSAAIYTELDAGGVTPEHKLKLIMSLYKQGFLFFDASDANIGFLQDSRRTPKIVDSNSYVPLHQIDDSFGMTKLHNITYRDQFQRTADMDFKTLAERAQSYVVEPVDYKAALAEHHEAIGLDLKDPSLGVLLTKDNLQAMRRDADGESELANAVEKLGLDRDLLQKLILLVEKEARAAKAPFDWKNKIRQTVKSLSQQKK